MLLQTVVFLFHELYEQGRIQKEGLFLENLPIKIEILIFLVGVFEGRGGWESIHVVSGLNMMLIVQ